jgi:cytochrome b
MKTAYANIIHNYPVTLFWRTSVRVLHWLTAICLVGAASFTEQGDTGHAELGWIAMGLLLLLQIIYVRNGDTNWALWFVTALVTAVNLSGWLSPDHTAHISVTLSSVMLAAFYFATVVFESVSLLLSRFLIKDPAM